MGARTFGGRRVRVLAATAMALLLTVSGTGLTSAYTIKLTVTQKQETQKTWCVPASAWMELKQIGLTPPSQQTLYDQGVPHKRCSAGNGLDPLAWAWILYANTGAGYFYDDFSYASAYAGTAAMAAQLVDHSEVAGALVNQGHHAMVFTGVTASCDLRLDSCWQAGPTFSTIYVNDPWYDWNTNTPGKDADGCPGSAGSGTYTCGKIGLQPNAAITYATWKAYYYTAWGHQDCAHWNGDFVAVLRKSSGVPAIVQGADDTKDLAHGPTFDKTYGVDYQEPKRGGGNASDVTVATDAGLATLDATFARASKQGGFSDRPELQKALDGGHLARTIVVRSLVTTFPDYLLATVVGKHGLLGVAMFTLEDPAHPAFAGMTYADDALAAYPALSASDAAKAARDAGYKTHGSPELVWGWSKETNSPYYPMYRLNTDAGFVFVASSGKVMSDPELEAPAR